MYNEYDFYCKSNIHNLIKTSASNSSLVKIGSLQQTLVLNIHHTDVPWQMKSHVATKSASITAYSYNTFTKQYGSK